MVKLEMPVSKVNSFYLDAGQRLGIYLEGIKIRSSSESVQRRVLFAAGVMLAVGGLVGKAMAQLPDTDAEEQYDDERMQAAVRVIFAFIEGGFGALIMVCAGIGAIVSSAFGQYRASLGLMIVALGSFILKSIVKTFFTGEFEQ